jgi:hypothetical protein
MFTWQSYRFVANKSTDYESHNDGFVKIILKLICYSRYILGKHMPKYQVTVKRTYETTLEVTAHSKTEAIELVQTDDEYLQALNIAESEQFECRKETYKAEKIPN